MTPAERALLLTVAKQLKNYWDHSERRNRFDNSLEIQRRITDVELEAAQVLYGSGDNLSLVPTQQEAQEQIADAFGKHIAGRAK